jgi:hypothetical protein
VAMCILDQQNILPHISAETREDLLMIDAMSRIANQSDERKSDNNGNKQIFRDILYRFKNQGLN